MTTIYIPATLIYFALLPVLIIVGIFCAFGPVLLWTLLLFRKRQTNLLSAYVHTGVETVGLVTQVQLQPPETTQERRKRQQAERIGSAFTDEGDRDWLRIQYAYAYDDGESTIVVKDFIRVPKSKLSSGRLFVVTLLPGQPRSGVPKFCLPEEVTSPDPAMVVLSYIGSVFCSANLILLFYFILLELGMGISETATTSETNHVLLRILLASSLVLIPGLGMACMADVNSRAVIPGKIVSQESVITKNDSPQAVVQARALGDWNGSSPLRPLVLSEAAAILDDDTIVESVLGDTLAAKTARTTDQEIQLSPMV